MPTSLPTAQMRHHRTKPAKAAKPRSNANSHTQFTKLQVISTFSSDSTTPSLKLLTQSRTYIFNCGEGMQRLCQVRSRLPRYSDIFLTRLNWDVAGGLPGYLLTTSDLENATIQIHGPKNLVHFLATFRNYIFRTNMNLSTNEFCDSPTPYEDESVTITPIPISPSPSTPPPQTNNSFANAFSFATPPLDGTEEEILAHKKDIVHEMFKRGVRSEDMDDEALSIQIDENRKRRAALMNVNLPPTIPSDITMAYFVKNRDSPGRFDLQKAQALKIPPGRLYSTLKAGEDVEIPVVDEDGNTTMKIVKSEDVVGNPIRGKTILILDIPGLQYVKKVVENDILNSEATKSADIIVHMLSDEVASDRRYINWMESFTKSSKHLVMAPKLTPDNLTLPDQYMLDLDRNLLDDSIFPLPRHAGQLNLTSNSFSKKYTPAQASPSPYKDERFITDVRLGSEFDGISKDVRYVAQTGEGVVEEKHYLGASAQNRLEIENVIKGTKTLISQNSKTRGENRYPGGEVEIITLGTGSAVPNKLRNVSCTVLRIPGEGNIILDSGEGALSSMKRQFSPSEFHDFFKQLRTIYISHLHADHHLGLIGVIKQYSKIQQSLPFDQRQPIFIIAPWRLLASLYEYSQVESIGLQEYIIPFASFNLIPRHLVPMGTLPQTLDLGLLQGFLSTMNLRSVETCFVPHCPQAFGVAITHKSGWKIVYSGDCRPSGDLVEIGRNATVCIHEATVAESEPQDALDKMHCTTGEAIMVGKRMGAQNILLTHFSQKWSRVPEFVIEWSKHKDETEKYGNVGIAFDHMTVKVRDMWKLPLMFSAFEALYGDERERKTWVKRKNAQVAKAEEVVEEPQKKKIRPQTEQGDKVILETGQ